MNDLMGFVERHPWWTFFYLLVICQIFNGMFKIVINRKGKV